MVEFISEDWPGGSMQGFAGPGWYFWDEVWANCIGPFLTEAACQKSLQDYVRQL